MKALGILGTASSAGKSWMATAVCAWLRSQGVRVAPFKAQNMSNNAWATLDGGEMARAQAVQAEACGLAASSDMNPILLKPTGPTGAQLVLQGRAVGHFEALDYFSDLERLWGVVATTLDGWREHCDVLVLEGAGSPVELNLMERDLVNLRPIRHLDGRWLLVADIDRGGVYAQLAGTWALLPEADRARGLGAVINRFRGDIRLFPEPQSWLAPHAPGLRVLGTVPWRQELQPEEEDGLSPADWDRGTGDVLAWIRLPHAANLTDCQPWWDDAGVRLRWVADPALIESARAIIIPGSKNSVADARWLHETGMGDAIVAAARRGVLVIGICGGFQMLGVRLVDTAGVAGSAGDVAGLGLLPVETEFVPDKLVRQVTGECEGERWTAYEVHMGRTRVMGGEPLQTVYDAGVPRAEGVRCGNVWGTYLHGWFECPRVRTRVAVAAGFARYRPHPVPWMEKRQAVYRAMAAHIAEHVDLDPVRRYLEL